MYSLWRMNHCQKFPPTICKLWLQVKPLYCRRLRDHVTFILVWPNYCICQWTNVGWPGEREERRDWGIYMYLHVVAYRFFKGGPYFSANILVQGTKIFQDQNSSDNTCTYIQIQKQSQNVLTFFVCVCALGWDTQSSSDEIWQEPVGKDCLSLAQEEL